MKKLLLLGGLRYLIPVIEAAHELGIYVITCDYLPDNIAHKYSDEYQNVSITDKDAVLALAKNLKIDGIMSFAVDPGVLTAAYVASELNIPSPGPFESIKILQNKALFRKFLKDNNFNVPIAKGYTRIGEAVEEQDFFKWPVIVKPVDSAGSKGVQKVTDKKCLEESIKHALFFSPSKQFIIEEFIEQNGYPTDSDCFSINGNLVYFTLSNQRFDNKAENPFTPAGFSWPSFMPLNQQKVLKSEVQRLLSLLKMETSIYNLEARIGNDGKPYIMELSPRGGGNRLAEVVRMATGIDLISLSVKSAVGIEDDNYKDLNYNGYWGEIILHSDFEGYFNEVIISPEIQKFVVELDIWVKKGDLIKPFTGANETIGTIVIRCDDQLQLNELVDNYKEWIKISVN